MAAATQTKECIAYAESFTRSRCANCGKWRQDHGEPKTITQIIADGLDACVDGRGWGEEHDNARKLANAAPALLAALEGVIDAKRGDHGELPCECEDEDQECCYCLATLAIRTVEEGR